MFTIYVSYNYIVQFNLYVYLEHLKIIVIEDLTDFIRDTHILKNILKKEIQIITHVWFFILTL